MPDTPDRSFRVKQLALRWRVGAVRIRALIRAGTLPAFSVAGQIRIAPEAVRELEQGVLAVRPRQRRRRHRIHPEIAAMLED